MSPSPPLLITSHSFPLSPFPFSLKVRMALHTGAAEEREGDYYGSALNRAARLMAIGHGGQVLLSEVTQQLVRDSLPEAVTLQSLGEHRLRDLASPEQVFQLRHPDLPDEFPPLKSLDNPDLPNNLPQQLTSFIGREKQMQQVKALLAENRLVTLTGAGGSGKSRLALQVAADLLEHYPDGVWLVELASLSDPDLVAQKIATALGVREVAGQPLLQTLLECLKPKKLLLVLDNCEHLLEACASLAEALLRSCPHLHILATSRERLAAAGEHVFRVPTLAIPDPQHLSSPEQLSQFESVRLFVDRAVAVVSEFTLTPQNASAVAGVCRHLDGIPLAIELASARIRAMTVEEINHRLEDRFRLLKGVSRTASPRHQTLRALIDWSYDLLNPPERLLLNRLAVFRGGWTLEAAEKVCAGEEIEEWEVLDLLTSLVDKSLVMAETSQDRARYRLLETVREYATEKLQQNDETAGGRSRHRDYFLTLAEEAEPQLYGPEQGLWLQRLETENDNLRAALEWCKVEEHGAEAGLRLAGALWSFWHVRGNLSELRTHVDGALRREGAARRTKERAKVLNGAGVIAYIQGEYGVAKSLIEEELAIFRELGDKQGIARSLTHMAAVLMEDTGDYGKARALAEESLSILQELGNKPEIALSLLWRGVVAEHEGDYASAASHYEQSLAISRELGDLDMIAWNLQGLGILAYRKGDFARARALLDQSTAIFRDNSQLWGLVWSLERYGGLAVAEGQMERAVRLHGAASSGRDALLCPPVIGRRLNATWLLRAGRWARKRL